MNIIMEKNIDLGEVMGSIGFNVETVSVCQDQSTKKWFFEMYIIEWFLDGTPQGTAPRLEIASDVIFDNADEVITWLKSQGSCGSETWDIRTSKELWCHKDDIMKHAYFYCYSTGEGYPTCEELTELKQVA